MAILSTLRLEIRELMHDSIIASDDCSRPLYGDAVYDKRIEKGLWRVNIDLETSYTLATLPERYAPLVVLLAAIEMCFIRGGEGASSDVSDESEAPLQSVAVPNLSVTQFARPNDGPAYWLKLAEKLKEEYKDILETLADTEGIGSTDIDQEPLYRMSLRTGTRTGYEYQTAFPAPELTLSESGGTVSLSWDPVYSKFLAKYQVRRGTLLSMEDEEIVATISDNHTVTYSDSPGVGTWYYRVSTHTFSGLASYSAASAVVIS